MHFTFGLAQVNMNKAIWLWGGFVFHGTMNQNLVPNVGDPGIWFSSFFNFNATDNLRTMQVTA
jgi:hypothetical protein